MHKILSFLEDHVEKMVLGIVLIVSLWLLVTRVVFSPNAISYEGQDYGPGAIDTEIRNQASKLEDVLNQRPVPPDAYQPRLGEYREILKSSVIGVDFAVSPLVPESNPQGATVVRKYNLPEVGQASDVVIGRIRAVAYIPIEEVVAEHDYDGMNSEPNDLDLVTVQGRYNIAALYASFADSFDGAGVKPEWRDPCLAEPVFAAVHLQRQKKVDDALWSQWEDVPKTKIDHRRGLFAVIEDARSLPPGGLTVRMLQYSDRQVQIDLLQPTPYQIASANEEWFPPILHEEYVAVRAAEALEERRREKEEEEKSKASDSDSTSRRRTSTSGRRTQGDTGQRTSSMLSGGRTSAASGRRTTTGRSGTSAARQPQETGRTRTARSRTGRDDTEAAEALEARREARPTVEDVRKKMNEFAIMPTTDLHAIDEVVFWAFDDDVEPGDEYRYRVRLGVFNPVAGRNQLSQRDATRDNDVILWSGFSAVSKTVEIPRRLYFFAKGIQEAAKEVTIQVSKYMLGYWYSEDFKVKGGEVIGDIVQTKVAKKTTASTAEPSFELDEQPDDRPEVIDYDTGAVLVDVVPVNDFSGDKTLRPRNYFDMLYSYDATRIERMPVGDRYWPEQLRVVRSEIRNSQRQPKQPFLPFAGTRKAAGRTATRRTFSRFDDE